MSLVFTGYYGQFNTGDDAFCIISDWAARKYWKLDNVKIFGENLPIRLDGSELNSSNYIKRNIKGKFYLELLTQGLLNSKIVYSGGSLFHSEISGFTKDSVFQHYHRLGLLKLAAIGVSIGPYKSLKARNNAERFRWDTCSVKLLKMFDHVD